MIKECLDILKPLVETSELWVEKASTSHSSAPKKNRKQSMDINEDNAEEVGSADPNRPVSHEFCHLAASVIWLLLSLGHFRFKVIISVLGLFSYTITSDCWPLEHCMQVV